MEEKQKINRKTKSEKIFAVIPKDLKERVIRYKAKTNMSESEIVNVALNEFFKVKILKDDMDDIAELMGKAIDSKLGKKFERMIMLIAKAGKSSYASLFLQAYFLSKVCETEESKEFLKEKIELANKEIELLYTTGKAPPTISFKRTEIGLPCEADSLTIGQALVTSQYIPVGIIPNTILYIILKTLFSSNNIIATYGIKKKYFTEIAIPAKK